ncbi:MULTISPECIES: ribonuclease P protein component [Comamonas]|jgi:ribonuclease P protein component|uniref:ribonuclease P protein component n=1 Tax=Comamonas TaxID=283 RepID=UPI0012CE9E89|nr:MULTISPECIES: ribonuclease P protein component [Comamonas]MDR3067122.1 ribonuclease P protein component [Comamonas sp.]MEB5966317.1 ribonuclease P protein component [Comamonas testosteroni]MPS94813.1 ribonuclease P [Comamonas sp.]
MQRLKTRPQFQATMSAGTIARTPHFALHRMELVAEVADRVANPRTGPGSSDPQALFGVGAVRRQAWLGAMVPKRWARRSVTRHTIKRQIYAVSSDYEDALLCASYVVRLRSGFDRKQFVSATSDQLKAAVRKELQQLFATGARRLMQARQAAATQGECQTDASQASDGKAQEATDSIANQPENQS